MRDLEGKVRLKITFYNNDHATCIVIITPMKLFCFLSPKYGVNQSFPHSRTANILIVRVPGPVAAVFT